MSTLNPPESVLCQLLWLCNSMAAASVVRMCPTSPPVFTHIGAALREQVHNWTPRAEKKVAAALNDSRGVDLATALGLPRYYDGCRRLIMWRMIKGFPAVSKGWARVDHGDPAALSKFMLEQAAWSRNVDFFRGAASVPFQGESVTCPDIVDLAASEAADLDWVLSDEDGIAPVLLPQPVMSPVCDPCLQPLLNHEAYVLTHDAVCRARVHALLALLLRCFGFGLDADGNVADAGFEANEEELRTVMLAKPNAFALLQRRMVYFFAAVGRARAVQQLIEALDEHGVPVIGEDSDDSDDAAVSSGEEST